MPDEQPRESNDQDTVEFPEVGFFAESYEPSTVRVGAATDRGKVRTENEDNYAVIERRRSQQVIASSVPLGGGIQCDAACLLIVADGMGGAAFGEFASRAVIQSTWDSAGRAASWVMKLKDLQSQQVLKRIQAYVDAFQQTLREHQEADPRVDGMGTTMTSVLIIGHDALVGHIGDSRVYLCRKSELQQITKDHSVAQRLIDEGHDPEAPFVRRHKHVLVNWLGGTENEDVKADVCHLTLQNGDKILLCTDGLTNEVQDIRIRDQLSSPRPPQEICHELIARALQAGGHDNITVIVAEIVAGEAPSA